ncbi:MAG: SDR family NAD(P)-dependent oxidoreductase [Flavobacteriales bacterium]|nr:SDR family NAD(P)-dependent oxidoreductase [Flavobacteriales bacterium]
MNIVITGCSRGIGLELVKLFSKQHNVYCLTRNIDPIEKYKNEVGDSGRINFLQFDFESFNTVELKTFLTIDNGIDVLINNAGYLVNETFSQISESNLRKMYEVNLLGPFRLIQNVIPFLREDNSHVINIGSMGGVQGSVKFPGLSAYSSSKGGLSILTECLAEEYKESNIKFNCLALGAVQTEMLNEAFPGYEASVSAIEMAQYIYSFALNGSRFINGKVISVSNSTP